MAQNHHAKSGAGRGGKAIAGGKRKAPDSKGSRSLGPNEKAIQLLLRKQKQAKSQSAAEPDAQRPRKGEGRAKTQEATALWEELRRQDTSDARRSELVVGILALIKGHMANVAASPTASRIIQSCVKYGSAADRTAILQEVQPHLVELAQNPYGHFLVSKLLAKASRNEASGYVKSFRGRVPQLLRHPNGASVIDDAYIAAYPTQRNAMAAEFYGKEFTLFEAAPLLHQGSVPESLKAVLASADAVKTRQILQSMSMHLIPIMEKGLVDSQLSHRLIAEYLESAPVPSVEDAVQTLSGPNLLRMAHTHDGAAAACRVLGYGTAKDRKQAVKAMHGHVKTMAQDQWAHLVLLTALSRVDDTALLRKNIISDVQANLAELLDSSSTRRVLLGLVSPDACRRTMPDVAGATFDPAPRYRSAAAPASDAEPDAAAADSTAAEVAPAEHGEPLGPSKKDSAARQRELLGSGKGSLARDLLSAVSQAAQQLLHGKSTGEFLVEVIRGGSDGVLHTAEPDALSALHDAVVQLAAKPLEAEGNEHVLVHFYSSRTLRRLVLASAEDDSGAAHSFAEKLWAVFDGSVKQYLGTHAEKVLASLLESGNSSVQSAAQQQIQAAVGQPADKWLASIKAAAAEKAPQLPKKATAKKQAAKRKRAAAENKA